MRDVYGLAAIGVSSRDTGCATHTSTGPIRGQEWARHYGPRARTGPAKLSKPGRTGGRPGDVQVAVLISGEGRAGQRPVAGRVTAGVAGPGRPHIATRIIIGPVRGRRARAGREVGQCTKPPGLGSGCGRGVTRGPHGLLPNEEGPRPATPQGRSWGTYGRTGNTTTVPAPRAGSGARGRRDRSGLTRRAATPGRTPGSKTPVARGSPGLTRVVTRSCG